MISLALTYPMLTMLTRHQVSVSPSSSKLSDSSDRQKSRVKLFGSFDKLISIVQKEGWQALCVFFCVPHL